MADHQSPLAVLVKGALAGAAAAATTAAFRERAPGLLRSMGIGGTEAAAGPVGAATASRPTGSGLGDDSERSIPPEAIPFVHGAGWGAYFAVIQSTFRPWPPLHGVFLGGLMTFVAARAPQLSVMPPARSRDEVAVGAASHVVFGVVTAVVYQVLNLGRRG